VLELKQRIEQEFQLGEVAEQKLMYEAGQKLMSLFFKHRL
jgi:hypothetical protein